MAPKSIQKADLARCLESTDIKLKFSQIKLMKMGLEGSEVFRKLQEASKAIADFEVS